METVMERPITKDMYETTKTGALVSSLKGVHAMPLFRLALFNYTVICTIPRGGNRNSLSPNAKIMLKFEGLVSYHFLVYFIMPLIMNTGLKGLTM